MDIKLFDFSRLERVSLPECRLRKVLDNIIPKGEEQFKFLLSLEKSMQQSIRGGCTLHSKGYRFEDLNTWLSRVGEEGTYVMLSTLSTGPKMLMIWDPVLALSLIDRLLGGELSEVPSGRKLTEIETGVFSYLLMQFCRSFDTLQQKGVRANVSAPIRVERIFSDQESLKNALQGATRLATANVTVAIPELTGEVQIVLPDIFIEEVLDPFIQAQETELSHEEQSERLNLMGDLTFPMRATVGEATLTMAEINGLQPGDIILLDQVHCQLAEGRLKGDVVLYPLRSGAPTVVTSIRDAGPPARLEIKEFYREA